MQAALKQKKFADVRSDLLTTQSMTGTRHLATKGCATVALRPELSSLTSIEPVSNIKQMLGPLVRV